MRTKTIRQTVIFPGAPPWEIYDLLMDSKKHAAFTGERASISPKVWGRISAYGGYIRGRNLELIKGKKIVQEWISSDWPEGHKSTVSFSFSKSKGGTRLTFVHRGVPAKDFSSKSNGWKEFYWKPMKAKLDARVG